ncbi:Eco57I restriction-modification methylase domain-containing protein [Staphylococcus simulans]|uniref:Eco57I restriction-modification methylase domain-containing protein n=1 Tax=Staphylococcus simulans TaxID=1286 RepID=UPI0021D2E0E4|nr:Eco57I restriction-modification methylase domain-containing protein [Staphylococcus simulans]UXR45671.1 Eco57I restriction-modification methylase domain-containing protein [Staphylococcus simulans]
MEIGDYLNTTIDYIEENRANIIKKLTNQKKFSQYFTPVSIAKFMTELFVFNKEKTIKLLDPGAGIGTLSAVFCEIAFECVDKIDVTAIEIDEDLNPVFEENLSLINKNKTLTSRLLNINFIDWANSLINKQMSFFNQDEERFSHIIMNPPYKKISSNSSYRKILKESNADTINLYSAFVGMAIKLLEEDGQLVAILPRSFCNGPYYRSFRELILNNTIIEHIHLFESRNNAFKEDGVLQENMIIKLKKSRVIQNVKVSTSSDATFKDYKENEFKFEDIVIPTNKEKFIHIPLSTEKRIYDIYPSINSSLSDLNLNISTGPVVGFRNKEFLRMIPDENCVPLFYAMHIENKNINWIKETKKKANAILWNEETGKKLYPKGYYVIMRRFSPKESKMRINSAVINPNRFKQEVYGFENSVNVIHSNKHGMDELLALGINGYISSTIFDSYFRTFNGHTQVNATDIRQMLFPNEEILLKIGKDIKEKKPGLQNELDNIIKRRIL